MYCPAHFQLDDEKIIFQLIQQYSFAHLVSCRNGVLEINQIPFLLDTSQRCLYAHVAKSNSHWKMLEKADDLKVCFSGPDAYISPNWFSHSQGVPTWNFVSVQITGKATLMDETQLLQLLIDLSAKHEANLKNPWTIEKLQSKKLDAMLKAIVGFKVSIDAIDAKAKLSQNHPPEEVQRLIAGLQQQNSHDATQVAEWMNRFL
ncbi:FMN-binding negative transcriptional regulator [Aliikangiella maris]|uniref:FMN-binding negative transcriptional regulator n=2 Tax=Aliikangiella maris TaxID=3162458 RepID=A0ABV3MMF8_9GAMM